MRNTLVSGLQRSRLHVDWQKLPTKTACGKVRVLVPCHVRLNSYLAVVADGARMDADAYGTLICSAFSEDFGQYNGEDHHIFVLLTNQWLLLLMYTIDLPGGVERNAEVMNLMAAAAEYSVRASLMNCGCYFNLPWLSSLCYTEL